MLVCAKLAPDKPTDNAAAISKYFMKSSSSYFLQPGTTARGGNLPGSANGFDVAEIFRAAVADIPVVYASGKWANRDRCVGGSLFFGKPYQSSEILTACLRLKNASPSN